MVSVNTVPFDVKEITDLIAGIRYEEEFGSFMRERDVRRRALPEELDDDIYGEPEDSTSFDNLRKIDFSV